MVQFSFCYIGYSQNANKPKPLKVYEKDGFKLKSYNYDGLESYLNHNNDTLYVINFWATWCVPCVKEMPYFEALNQKYKAGKFTKALKSEDASIFNTSKFWIFTRLPPVLPAMRIPLNTRPGNEQAPIEPGALKRLC